MGTCTTALSMTTVDDLWYLADTAAQQAEQTYHQLTERYDNFHEFETIKHVSRRRFRTVASRINRNGAPYGAHTLTFRETGEILLVRHEGVDLWVLPGGQATDNEEFKEAAKRELSEEAGVDAEYQGLGMLGTIRFHTNEYSTWGVLPLFEARASTTTLRVDDPDGEISAAEWYSDLPADTRDREQLLAWRDRRLSETTDAELS